MDAPDQRRLGQCQQIVVAPQLAFRRGEALAAELGFGQPLDYEPWIMLPGGITSEFEGQIRYLADGLGVEVSEIRETYDRRLTEEPIETAFGTVEPGTTGAIRFQAIGVVAVIVYAALMTFVILKVMGAVMVLRAEVGDEGLGMDVTQHGEEAYTSGEGAILVLPDVEAPMGALQARLANEGGKA